MVRITCSVCRNVFFEDPKICATSCGHIFHSGCLAKWLTRKENCPLCETSIKKDKPIKLYFNTLPKNEYKNDDQNLKNEKPKYIKPNIEEKPRFLEKYLNIDDEILLKRGFFAVIATLIITTLYNLISQILRFRC